WYFETIDNFFLTSEFRIPTSELEQMSTLQASRPMTSRAEPVSPIRVYNTLAKIKEPFVPVQPGKVGIYLCGPTVYKPSHIGHAVGPVIFDTIKRYLKLKGFPVTCVLNIM